MKYGLLKFLAFIFLISPFPHVLSSNANKLDSNINIKTESYAKNFPLYIKEGQVWARNKYGFNSRWQFLFYTKYLYNRFFEFYPNLKKYEI